MLNAKYFPFASSATETVVAAARRNVEAFDQVASAAKGTPAAALFDMASKFQHTALENFEAMAGALEAEATETTSKSKKATEKAVKSAADVAKKAVDAQADLMVNASAKVAKGFCQDGQSREESKEVRQVG